MQFKHKSIIIQNNQKKNMLTSFKKYLISSQLTKFYIQIIYKRNYQKYLQKCIHIKRKNNRALQMKIFLKFKQ